jgi:hypothetical protein
MESFIVLVVVLALAVIPASIARSKGRSYVKWYIFGFFLFLPALIASLVVEARKPCPACSSSIPRKANICVFCGADVREAARAAQAKPVVQAPKVAPVQQPVPPKATAPVHSEAAVKPPSTSSDELKALEELKMLAGLRQQGVVTEEEFESKKAELLTRV